MCGEIKYKKKSKACCFEVSQKFLNIMFQAAACTHGGCLLSGCLLEGCFMLQHQLHLHAHFPCLSFVLGINRASLPAELECLFCLLNTNAFQKSVGAENKIINDRLKFRVVDSLLTFTCSLRYLHGNHLVRRHSCQTLYSLE